MIRFTDKRIEIDGKSVFLLSGELHYFRQPRENWPHLIDEAKAMGLNCIASYIPWLLHEEARGEFRFEDNLDVGAFIDLCGQNGMYFFARPGPFIMAEMKNEGLPYWVAETYPDALPVGFDGKVTPSTTLDYLHPGYLASCAEWYRHICEVIRPRLISNGGCVIGFQLDNEVGMLNWVTNLPVLTDNVLNRFADWLKAQYSQSEIAARYPGVALDDLGAFRSPQESYSVAFHNDYGRFMRAYYCEYLLTLRTCALENGITGVPFFVNIHGTGEHRIFDFPLGVSQLYQAYNAEADMVSGTDVYLGELTEGTYQDMYVCNAITDAMNKRGNPLTSIEFGCSDGPYCSLSGMRFHPSAPSHSMVMSLSQNARMINFYVFSGGENYPLRYPRPDGDGRMAFTGQMHGLNAPVQPDGSHAYPFDRIAATARGIHALNELIARAKQVTDNVSLGFIPDYFLTETRYPASANAAQLHDNLKRWRCAYRIDSICRALLGHHIHFDARDIQNDPLDDLTAPETRRALVVLSARYMDGEVQRKLIDYARRGGALLLYGELPEYDMDGNPCTELMNALGLSGPFYLTERHPTYYPSIDCAGAYAGRAPMHRATAVQCFPMTEGGILTPDGGHSLCGIVRALGTGTVAAITADYPADMGFFGALFEELGIRAFLRTPHWRQGVYIARAAADDGQQLLYLINLDSQEKDVPILLKGAPLFESFYLAEKASMILPLGVRTPCGEIVRSTAELVAIEDGALTFRLTQPHDTIVLKTNRPIVPSEHYCIEVRGEETILAPVGAQNGELTVRFS